MIEVLKDSNIILQRLKANQTHSNQNLLCMYNSRINAILTDRDFMSIAIEDKIVSRAYSVFDTTKVFENKIFNIDQHLDRFLDGISNIELKSKFSKQELKDILAQLAATARQIEPKSDIDLRFYYSAGVGNFGIQVDEDNHTFYAIAIRVDNTVRPTNGTQDFTIKRSEIIKKIEKSKTTSYLANCIINKIVKQKQGYLGIMLDDEGNMLEGPISNIAFVMKNNSFRVPSFEKTLKGTTIIKCLRYIEENMIHSGDLSEISREDVNLSHLENGEIIEAMFVGGDFIVPLLKINDYLISDEPGLVARKLQSYLEKEKKSESFEAISNI